MTHYTKSRNCRRCSKVFVINRSTNYYCSDECLFLSSFVPGAPDDCWEWQGNRWKHGYGGFNGIYGYVYSYHYYNKTFLPEQIRSNYRNHFPVGIMIRHSKCGNKKCVNPNHLETGTAKDNKNDDIKHDKIHSPIGILNSSAKLTEDQVRKIFTTCRPNFQVIDSVASANGVSTRAIFDILTGLTWHHITGLPNARKRKK